MNPYIDCECKSLYILFHNPIQKENFNLLVELDRIVLIQKTPETLDEASLYILESEDEDFQIYANVWKINKGEDLYCPKCDRLLAKSFLDNAFTYNPNGNNYLV